MALPETIRVKLSSEGVGAISITPVVVQELPLRELIEHMLGIAGKDEPRLREILLRGSLVSGASRFRWAGWEVEPEGLRSILATFPDPDPSIPFRAGGCVGAILRGGRVAIEIPREAVSGKSLLRRQSFWDSLMEIVAAREPVYSGYSYRHHADRYLREFAHTEVEALRSAAHLIRYSTLRKQVRAGNFTSVELHVER
ncbi:MAG TPA: hypothetical protein VG675_12640 [Bryobacteraceae bacterium]|nr:hypothetical protein [Bryobacteraceae bacterium]